MSFILGKNVCKPTFIIEVIIKVTVSAVNLNNRTVVCLHTVI